MLKWRFIDKWAIIQLQVLFIVFNATFNNMSVISWGSGLLVEETGVPGEHHRPVGSHWQIYHILLYRVRLVMNGFELITLVVIGIDYIQLSSVHDHDGPYSAILWREQIIIWRGDDACFVVIGTDCDHDGPENQCFNNIHNKVNYQVNPEPI